MRIAQVSPLYERVPPRYYGGTERIVSYLTEELVEQGHEVTLFASGDSKTKARLVAGSELGLRLNPETADYNPYHVLQLEQVMQEAEAFDIIHFHTDYPHFRGDSKQQMLRLSMVDWISQIWSRCFGNSAIHP